MKFSGLLLKESLKNKSVLDLIKITKTEIWNNVKNAEKNQPNDWTESPCILICVLFFILVIEYGQF